MEALDGLVDVMSPNNSNMSKSKTPVNSAKSIALYAPAPLSCVTVSNTKAQKYDMSYMPDLSSKSSMYPRPERDQKKEESSPMSKASRPAAKRKRENRYKNAPLAVLLRRRAQNRASQRAYRERKEQLIKDLESMLREAMQRNDELRRTYALLNTEVVQLKNGHRMEGPFEHTTCSTCSHPGATDLLYEPTMCGPLSSYTPDMDSRFVYPEQSGAGPYNFSMGKEDTEHTAMRTQCRLPTGLV